MEERWKGMEERWKSGGRAVEASPTLSHGTTISPLEIPSATRVISTLMRGESEGRRGE